MKEKPEDINEMKMEMREKKGDKEMKKDMMKENRDEIKRVAYRHYQGEAG